MVTNVGKVQLTICDSTTMSHVGSFQQNEGKVINYVLSVPAFEFNLSSVTKLTKELNYCILFFPTCVF